ncbi:hypothetical protein KSF_104870 [Reticulibacter mediterranei]|uniref:Uncharacterized protein n=1 Tax=Reticulibacter mediterranei TaxID=2778369 RepID=A0A8J3IR45_9CHLR|nr:hypothetical protein KSF_104870 [Reticulibacter mediterranei]
MHRPAGSVAPHRLFVCHYRYLTGYTNREVGQYRRLTCHTDYSNGWPIVCHKPTGSTSPELPSKVPAT